jgi:uncharacterized membrane protein YhaH (DUF805 family)
MLAFTVWLHAVTVVALELAPVPVINLIAKQWDDSRPSATWRLFTGVAFVYLITGFAMMITTPFAYLPDHVQQLFVIGCLVGMLLTFVTLLVEFAFIIPSGLRPEEELN